MTQPNDRNEYGGRLLAIGDIHGCSLAFEQIIKFLALKPEDIIVTIGDYIDRGPDSSAVVEQLIDLQQRCHLVPLMGNHEHMLLQLLQGNILPEFWLNCGGQETLQSYGGSLQNIPTTHLAFIQGCRPWYETDRHIFVHANYAPQLPMDEQPEELRLWQHLTVSIPPPHLSGKTVIVGHSPQATGLVLNAGHLICIDTFCFGRGCLTALDVLTGDIWQVNKYGVRCQP